MTFRATARMQGLTESLAAIEANAADGAKRAMDRAGDQMKQDLRDQILAAGLGDRLAKTWQGKTYPTKGGSLTPAAYVWSKAPGIVDAYARGVTIVANAGRRFLAVPSDDCPRQRNGRALTPEQVESRFGKRLIFISPSDRGFKTPSMRHGGVGYLVLRDVVVRKASGRWRNASPREVGGNTRNPRPVQMVIMFTLVASVKIPKKLDLQAVLNRAAATLPQLLAEEWGQ